MELVTPGIGLLFWMLVSFAIVVIILKKIAWKPILKALKEREDSIEDALESAEKAKEEMAKLQVDNEKIINEAKAERDNLINEAREVKETIINEAKIQATTEANKLIEQSRINIKNEKVAAINEIKEQVAVLSVEIAEKILKQELAKDKKQEELINSLLKEIKVN